MPPEQFVKEGAPHRIKTILTDLTENPATNITDGKGHVLYLSTLAISSNFVVQ